MGEFVTVETDQAGGHDPAGPAADERAERPGPGRDRGGRRAGGRDDGVRAVVLYGGEKVFAAGADIKEMAEPSYAQMAADQRRLQAAFTAVARIPKPVVAAITGYALGGGLELALCADFRVAGESARVGQPEILLGVIPGAGGTQRLPRLIGPARAKDIVFTGRFVGRAEALGHRPGGPGGPGRRGVRGGARRWWPGTPAGPRSPCGPPSRPSMMAWRPTWPPGWRSSGCSSPGLFATEDQRDRDAQLHREWSWEGHLRRAVTLAGTARQLMSRPEEQPMTEPVPSPDLARHGHRRAARGQRRRRRSTPRC